MLQEHLNKGLKNDSVDSCLKEGGTASPSITLRFGRVEQTAHSLRNLQPTSRLLGTANLCKGSGKSLRGPR
jgi:hypothetical protein